MFAKRLIQKAVQHHHHQHNVQHGYLASEDLELQVGVHYGIPSTASVLAFDPIQRLLAIGTLDGRIKVIGGDGIEALLISPNQLSYKNMEFLQNKGYLVGISNENEIQIWNLEWRCLVCCLQWETNITAFSVISGSFFMYIGDENGLMSVVKYDVEDAKLRQLPYHVSANSMSEAAGYSFPSYQPIIGVLPQPCTSGNRVLIAYENGLIILWDVSEDQILFVGGGADLQLKDSVADDPTELGANLPDKQSEHNLGEKEISALCWASSNGSILAVGYLDGDIFFYNTSSAATTKAHQAGLSSTNVVKLQLSSAERRIPVIVLQWSKSKRPRNDGDGQLFVYGGDEIGSEEVLTILNIEWSSGMETLRCAGRADLTLTGSFADMILLPSVGPTGSSHRADIFVLTNPGQLHLYDDESLSALISQQEKRPSVSAVEFPMVIPTTDPSMTASKLIKLSTGGKSSKDLSEIVFNLGSTALIHDGSTKWPLTGGVPGKSSISDGNGIERLYLAGYQDGSVRIWDATYPVLSFLCTLKSENLGIKVAVSNAPVSNLDFCFFTLDLAAGNECGLVRVYNLKSCSEETRFHIVTDTTHEVHSLPHEEGPGCKAAFCLLNSPVQALRFANTGAKLAIGFESGHVAVVDMSSLSVLFFRDSVSGSSSPVISIIWKELSNTNLLKSPKHSETKIPVNPMEEVLFLLTKDAKVNIIDGDTGNMISSRPLHLKKESTALSMYVIEDTISATGLGNEKQPDQSVSKNDSKSEPMLDNSSVATDSHDTEQHSSSETFFPGEMLLDSLILLCCEDSLLLYSAKSVIQGKNKTIRKVNHEKPCCWTATFEKDEKLCGLALLYQTGAIEIRSLPDLELVKETSLMSILRWNFKANMEKTMSSSVDGQITLVNGCEMAVICLLAGGNDLRILESLPCLHDKVVAAAADAAFSFSSNQKRKQGAAPGILGSIVKGFQGGKAVHNEDLIAQFSITHLDGIFSKSPFSHGSPTTTYIQEFVDPLPTNADNQEVVELNIDDIEIDEPLHVASTSIHKVQNKKNDKRTDREKLFEGANDDTKPRLRTREEIIATYRKTGDASSVAAHARDKLVERQEKLEKISRRTEDLKNGAEDFASLANELVKTMENRRKWWQI